MPQLDLASFPSLLLWLAVGFCFLYLGLRYVILPRLSAIQEVRFSQIDSILDKAESFRALATEIETKREHERQAYEQERMTHLLEMSKKLDSLLETSKKEVLVNYEQKCRDAGIASEKLYKKLHSSLKGELSKLVCLSLEEIYEPPQKETKRTKAR